MKDSLDRLLSAAAQGRESNSDLDPPFGLEARVLSDWRAERNEDSEDGWLAAFRPLISVATGIMLLCIALNFATLARLADRSSQSAEITVVDSPIRLALSR